MLLFGYILAADLKHEINQLRNSQEFINLYLANFSTVTYVTCLEYVSPCGPLEFYVIFAVSVTTAAISGVVFSA